MGHDHEVAAAVPLSSGRRARAGIWLGGFLLLTAFTQAGGAALLAAWPFARRAAWRGGLAFALAYTALMAGIVPWLAPLAGRVPLPCGVGRSEPLEAASWLSCVLGRNYTRPQVRNELRELAAFMQREFPGTRTRYLDANLAFGDGFPLLPHLSHRDGLKVDLAFYYPADRQPSPVGYWVYEQPRPGEPTPCRGRRSWLRWDFAWLQPLLAEEWDGARTGAALRWLLERPSVERVLLEPHLQQRLGLVHDKLRFQGCHAARHDDHFHLSMR